MCFYQDELNKFSIYTIAVPPSHPLSLRSNVHELSYSLFLRLASAFGVYRDVPPFRYDFDRIRYDREVYVVACIVLCSRRIDEDAYIISLMAG